MLTHGVHGGPVAPLGYDFTVRGHDRRGNAQRGPLQPNKDARKVKAAFAARASDDPKQRAWSNVVAILGVASQGAARNIFANRVYLGEARSGEFVKPGAHPPLVDEALFRRANRRRVERSVSYAGRPGALLGGKIIRCAGCGYSLTFDRNPRGHVYRCKNLNCTSRASVQAAAIEPYVFLHALAWHATLNPMHIREIQDASVPVFEQELATAQAELAEIEAMHERGELTPLAYGKALAAADLAVRASEVALADAEASTGWLGLNTDAVQQRLLGPGNSCKDIEAGRDFIRQMVRVTVKSVGRGRKVPLPERVEIENLTPVAALQEQAFVEMTVARTD